jgi:hypothetical protein
MEGRGAGKLGRRSGGGPWAGPGCAALLLLPRPCALLVLRLGVAALRLAFCFCPVLLWPLKWPLDT